MFQTSRDHSNERLESNGTLPQVKLLKQGLGSQTLRKENVPIVCVSALVHIVNYKNMFPASLTMAHLLY